jgi:hypothetical protein
MYTNKDGYKVNIDSKYGNYIKLGLAALTAFGLVGTGAHQAGIIDVFICILSNVSNLIHYFTPFSIGLILAC